MVYLEITGTFFAVMGVWLTARNSIWCWSFHIVAILVYIYVFWQTGIYGDAGLQVFYLLMAIYGWYFWLRGGSNQSSALVESMKWAHHVWNLLFSLTSTAIIYYLLKRTDSNIPLADALTTAFSLSATWLMARKFLQNWIYWIVIDLTAAGIYWYKDLHVTALQYIFFAGLAAYGYLNWKKSMENTAGVDLINASKV